MQGDSEEEIDQDNPNVETLEDDFGDSMVNLFEENSESNPQDDSDPDFYGDDIISQEPHDTDAEEEPRRIIAAACSAISEANRRTVSSSSRNREEEIHGSDQTTNRGMRLETNQISSSETFQGARESNQIPMQRPLSAPAPPPWTPQNTYQQLPMSFPQPFGLPIPNPSRPMNYHQQYNFGPYWTGPYLAPGFNPQQHPMANQMIPMMPPREEAGVARTEEATSSILQGTENPQQEYRPNVSDLPVSFSPIKATIPNPSQPMYYTTPYTLGPTNAPNQMSIITNEVPYRAPVSNHQQHPVANQTIPTMQPRGDARSARIEEAISSILQDIESGEGTENPPNCSDSRTSQEMTPPGGNVVSPVNTHQFRARMLFARLVLNFGPPLEFPDYNYAPWRPPSAPYQQHLMANQNMVPRPPFFVDPNHFSQPFGLRHDPHPFPGLAPMWPNQQQQQVHMVPILHPGQAPMLPNQQQQQVHMVPILHPGQVLMWPNQQQQQVHMVPIHPGQAPMWPNQQQQQQQVHMVPIVHPAQGPMLPGMHNQQQDQMAPNETSDGQPARRPDSSQ